MFLKELEGEDQQVVKVDGVAGAQRAVIAPLNVAGEHGRAFIGKGAGLDGSAFKTAQETQDLFGIARLALCRNVTKDFFDRSQLLGFVVDDKVFLVSKEFDMKNF